MSDPILSVTHSAAQKLRTVQVGGKSAEGSAVRIRVFENGASYRYEFSFVEPGTIERQDTEVSVEGLRFCLDPESVPRLSGSTLDYVDDLSGSGFRFDNPNKTRLASNPLAERIQQVLDEQINPTVGQHGGHVSLIDIEADRVFVQFGGGCQGCGQADATFKQGVVVAIKQAIPEVAEVLDATDHGAGANPYY